MERVFVERVFGVEARFVEPLFVVARFVPVLRVFADFGLLGPVFDARLVVRARAFGGFVFFVLAIVSLGLSQAGFASSRCHRCGTGTG